jgi:hypothetical protein
MYPLIAIQLLLLLDFITNPIIAVSCSTEVKQM